MTAAIVIALAAVALLQTHRLREARALARTDELTGIGNRRFFDEALARARRRGRPLAAVYVDLDQLKKVNDTLGHRAGDEMLIRVARTLRRRCRSTDVVARLGGDEFVILLLDGDEAAAEALADNLAERLDQASVGWSSEENAIEDADRLMYERKRDRREKRRAA